MNWAEAIFIVRLFVTILVTNGIFVARDFTNNSRARQYGDDGANESRIQGPPSENVTDSGMRTDSTYDQNEALGLPRLTSVRNAFIHNQMIDEFLQGQAAVFVSGSMTREEREQFELILEFHDELREFVGGLADIGTALTLATQPSAGAPSPRLKERIAALTANRPQQTTTEGLVMSGPDGLVQWINPAFSAMCGYTLEELRGRKLGPILQGAKTDQETVERMRSAVHAYRPCIETILNYHKNGTPYWVEIAITPIFGDVGKPLWLVARERELTDRAAA